MTRKKALEKLKKQAAKIVEDNWSEEHGVYFHQIRYGNHCVFANYFIGADIKAISVEYDEYEDEYVSQ